MFVACDIKYFEIGDVVKANCGWGDAPLKVIGMKRDSTTGEYLYELEVDVSNHPEGFDENGERIATTTAHVWASHLAKSN